MKQKRIVVPTKGEESWRLPKSTGRKTTPPRVRRTRGKRPMAYRSRLCGSSKEPTQTHFGMRHWRLLLPSTGQLLADLEPGDVILIIKVNVRSLLKTWENIGI